MTQNSPNTGFWIKADVCLKNDKKWQNDKMTKLLNDKNDKNDKITKNDKNDKMTKRQNDKKWQEMTENDKKLQ